MRRNMDTRGILRPGQVGRVFELERPAVAAALRELVASHWAVTWNLPEGEARRSEVLPHPALHLVAERDGVWVYGVPALTALVSRNSTPERSRKRLTGAPLTLAIQAPATIPPAPPAGTTAVNASSVSATRISR
jgi:hypothetical protein